jgi:WD repeat-containing protein 19
VGKSQSDGLAHQLIDFLVGEKDGMPKDPNYIYRLYMALKKYDDAAKTALIIARQEQDMGNYTLAHSVVVEIIQHLEASNIKVSLQLRQTFVLLHSYIRVKHMVRGGDHTGAARMLLRVAQSASKFPLHVVPILTSTVIECQRAGLKTSAYEYAVMLMRPEHRNNIEATLKRKIEAIVRRRSQQGDEAPEDLSPCPISRQMIPLTQLECPTTRDALPMCAVSGRHMVLDDWCFCPVSKSPVLFSEYIRYIEADLLMAKEKAESKEDGKSDGKETAVDPVMRKPVAVSDLKLCPPEEAEAYIKRYNNVLEEKKPNLEDSTEIVGGENGSLSSPTKREEPPKGASRNAY